MRARDYRKRARRALRGQWVRVAALLLLACAVLGVLLMIITFAAMGPLMISVFQGLDNMVYGAEATGELVKIPAAFFVIVTIGTLLVSVAESLLLVGMSGVGRAVLGGKRPGPRLLFPFRQLGKAVVMNLVRAAVVGLASLLLIAPGVIALYRYSMADYLLAAHPNLGPVEALRRSARRMKGRKTLLFRLQISFLGWAALCVLPSFAVNLWAGTRFGAAFVISFAVTLLCGVAALFVAAYLLVAVTDFFRRADRGTRKRIKPKSE